MEMVVLRVGDGFSVFFSHCFLGLRRLYTFSLYFLAAGVLFEVSRFHAKLSEKRIRSTNVVSIFFLGRICIRRAGIDTS